MCLFCVTNVRCGSPLWRIVAYHCPLLQCMPFIICDIFQSHHLISHPDLSFTGNILIYTYNQMDHSVTCEKCRGEWKAVSMPCGMYLMLYCGLILFKSSPGHVACQKCLNEDIQTETDLVTAKCPVCCAPFLVGMFPIMYCIYIDHEYCDSKTGSAVHTRRTPSVHTAIPAPGVHHLQLSRRANSQRRD